MMDETVEIPVLALWIMAGIAASYVLIPLILLLWEIAKAVWEECHRV